VLAPGVEQAAAMIATPATMAASRRCFFMSIVVSSLDPDGMVPIRFPTAGRRRADRSGRHPGL
jgi:hypothetical protein